MTEESLPNETKNMTENGRDESTRRYDADRQNKALQRKRDAGLKVFKIHMDRETLGCLEDIAIKMGYQNPMKNGRVQLDTLSQVIGYCVRSACYGRGEEAKYSSHRLSQEYLKTGRAAQHQKESAEQNLQQISKYLHTNKHRTFEMLKEDIKHNPKKSQWTEAEVALLLDDGLFLPQLKKLNKLVTSKKTRETLSS